MLQKRKKKWKPTLGFVMVSLKMNAGRTCKDSVDKVEPCPNKGFYILAEKNIQIHEEETTK